MHKKLKEIKKENNLTIEKMAQTLGVSISYLAKILNGDRKPSRAFMEKVKEVYPTIDLNEFF